MSQAQGTEEVVRSRRESLRTIVSETTADVDRFEGAPFTGRTMAQYMAYHAAAIIRLAEIVESLLPEDES